MNTPSALARFMAANDLTQVRFAQLSGVPQCQISAYLRGRRKPGRENALAIERATGGAVTTESWDAPRRRSGRPAKFLARSAR